ncbi:MAG: hypothetical protein AAF765_05820 [Bacteroidota bacterium]
MAAQNNEALFRKKILGLLSAEEERLFDLQFSDNSDFREQYFVYKEMMEVVIVAEKKALKQKLERLNQSKKKKLKLWLPLAASFILLIGLASIFYSRDTNDLYDTYFDTYPNLILPTTRGGQENGGILEKAFFNYDRRQFEEANRAFETYLQNNKDSRISFYQAMGLMNSGKLEEAKKILVSVEKSENESFEYMQETRWYLALLYMREGNKENAVKLLETNKAKESDFKLEETDDLLVFLKELE